LPPRGAKRRPRESPKRPKDGLKEDQEHHLKQHTEKVTKNIKKKPVLASEREARLIEGSFASIISKTAETGITLYS